MVTTTGAQTTGSHYERARGSDRFLALGFCGVLLIFGALCAPFRLHVYGVVPNFLQVYGIVLGTSEILTAVLLLWRARAASDGRLATLAASYAFSAPLIVANIVTIPGVSAPPGSFPFEAAPWIWALWHIGWGVGVAAFALSPPHLNRRPGLRWIAAVACAGAVIVAAIGTLDLPRLLNPDGTFAPPLFALYFIALAAYAVALQRIIARRRSASSLEIWIGVAVLALALDVMFTMFSAVRFSLGFYVARVLGMTSGIVVLLALFNDCARLIRRGELVGQYEALTAQLRDSDVRLRTFLETVPQIVWTADASGWIDWYNPRWFEFTGQTPQEAAGWGWQAAHHPEDFAAVMERWPDSIATGEAFEMEFRLRRYDGEFQWFLTRIVPHRDHRGHVVRWYGSNTNIDAHKREAQRSARIAQLLQEAFLPERLPERTDLRFDALYLPAESDALVGGDWYDAITLPDGRILISCGDVAGHGLDAAILAGRFRQSIALSGLEDPDPARVLGRVNRIAMLQGEGMTTAIVAVLDPDTRKLEYALAGHPPPIVATPAQTAHLLEFGGLPLGVAQQSVWQTRSVALDRDAVVVFYTDGVTEFAHDIFTAEKNLCDAADVLLGDVRTARPALSVKNAVMDSAPPRDDVAILILQLSQVVTATAFDESGLTKKWRFHSSDALTAHNSRRALGEYLASLAADPNQLYEAELVVGEAIANTVEHAPGIVEVLIDWRDERPTLTVRDTGPGFVPGRASLPSDELSEDGRGMFLIHALASDVHVRRSPGYGMELQCVLPLPRRASLNERCAVSS
ncbi:MAG: hypothetical protein NVS3B28_25010 [Candidatus Velthaea sp.]